MLERVFKIKTEGSCLRINEMVGKVSGFGHAGYCSLLASSRALQSRM